MINFKKEFQSAQLSNKYLKLNIAAKLGGRILQVYFNQEKLFWTNNNYKSLLKKKKGKNKNDSWLNWGGEKLWLAPQGWNGANEWDGPPNPIDNAEYRICQKSQSAISLTGNKQEKYGILLSRQISIKDDSSKIHVQAYIQNIVDEEKKWSIWPVLQLDAQKADGGVNDKLYSFCPINDKSIYDKGFKIKYGIANNPQFYFDEEVNMLVIPYKYIVGKVGVDAYEGWVGTCNYKNGICCIVFFETDSNGSYPHEDSTIEVWTQGAGSYYSRGKLNCKPKNLEENPAYIELEIFSPQFSLKPGQKKSFNYDIAFSKIDNQYKIKKVCSWGILFKEFEAAIVENRVNIEGGIGVFYKGHVEALLYNAQNELCQRINLGHCGPTKPFMVDHNEKLSIHKYSCKYLKIRMIKSCKNGKNEIATLKL